MRCHFTHRDNCLHHFRMAVYLDTEVPFFWESRPRFRHSLSITSGAQEGQSLGAEHRTGSPAVSSEQLAWRRHLRFPRGPPPTPATLAGPRRREQFLTRSSWPTILFPHLFDRP